MFENSFYASHGIGLDQKLEKILIFQQNYTKTMAEKHISKMFWSSKSRREVFISPTTKNQKINPRDQDNLGKFGNKL